MKPHALPALRALTLALLTFGASAPLLRAADESKDPPESAQDKDSDKENGKKTKDPEKKKQDAEEEKEKDEHGAQARSLARDDDESAQERYSRETAEMDRSWAPILEEARRSTVRLLHDGKPIAFATAVSEKGYLLTKSSEVHDSKGHKLEDLTAQFPGGITLSAKISDVHPRYDLALLKVEATGLTPLKWDSGTLPAPGSYVAAVTPERLPAAVGVLSVSPRNMDEAHKGFLGISLSAETGKLRISRVGEDSAASEAGLLKDDIVQSINGQKIASVAEFIELIGARKPYETIKVLITRGEQDKELTATLRRRPDGFTTLAEDARNTISGPVSRNRGGYPTAFQHDMVLQPNQCGGPVIDLDGKVIGLNIARSGRIECCAIPAATVVKLLEKVDSGKFSRPELDDIRKELQNAEALFERLKKDTTRLRDQLKEAEGG